MNFAIKYSKEKDILLQATRGISFDDIIRLIEDDKVLADIAHPNEVKYPNQRIYVVEIKKYAYLVPYVVSKEEKTIFLKTVYPSRVYTKKFIKKYEK